MKARPKELKETIIRGKHTYKRVGSFSSKSAATRYKREVMYSIMITRDIPWQFGVGVKYHVFRRVIRRK